MCAESCTCKKTGFHCLGVPGVYLYRQCLRCQGQAYSQEVRALRHESFPLTYPMEQMDPALPNPSFWRAKRGRRRCGVWVGGHQLRDGAIVFVVGPFAVMRPVGCVGRGFRRWSSVSPVACSRPARPWIRQSRMRHRESFRRSGESWYSRTEWSGFQRVASCSIRSMTRVRRKKFDCILLVFNYYFLSERLAG